MALPIITVPESGTEDSPGSSVVARRTLIRLTRRSLGANRIRLALTAFAVVLGVSFVVSSFVLTDGLRSSFGNLSTEIAGTSDLEISPTSSFGDPVPLDASLMAGLTDIDGVAAVAGQVMADSVQPIRSDGTPVTTNGAPLLGSSWVDVPSLSRFAVVEGRAPEAGMEFTIDSTSAAANGLMVGEHYEVVTRQGRFDLELVGLTRFGTSNATLGAVLSQFPLGTAQQMFDRVGRLDAIAVALDVGADREQVSESLAARLPVDTEVRTNAEVAAATRSDFDQGIDIINNVLLAFAFVALFVSAFIVANTFAIVLGQRSAELALLRAIGATGRQIRAATMLEALLIGVTASIVGIGSGVGLGVGLKQLFAALGAGLPESPTSLAPRTIVAALVVGIGVTVASAWGPARKASRVEPIRAMRLSGDVPRATSGGRLVTGSLVGAVGVGLGSLGLFADLGSTARVVVSLGAGAVAVFLAVALLAPAITRPLVTALGVPLRSLGIAGRLSTQNAARNPRRTSATAASLTIGLALVTTALIVGESIKASIAGTLDASVYGDYVTDIDDEIGSRYPEAMSATGVFDAVAGYRYDEAMVGGEVVEVVGTDLVATADLFDLGLSAGALSAGPDRMAVSGPEARRRGLVIGDVVPVSFPTGIEQTLEVTAVFESQTVIDLDYLLADNDWQARFGSADDSWASARLRPGIDDEAVAAALVSLEEFDPTIALLDREAYLRSVEGDVDATLAAINVLLALAIVIALIGIANTIALSVFERTREIGLLRAVGMSRHQIRRMVRWEAVQVSLLGAVLGIAVGVLFGWGSVSAMPPWFVDRMAVPYGRITMVVGVCALAGVAAAALPARRAARLDIIDALATV